MTLSNCFAAVFVLAILTGGTMVRAQDAPQLSLELNAAADTPEGGCRLTYVVNNRLAGPLDKTGFQMAVFDAAGVVTRLMALDFGALPVGKTKIMQFDVPGQVCTQISRIVVNEATSCVMAGFDATPGTCIDGLATASKSSIQFGL